MSVEFHDPLQNALLLVLLMLLAVGAYVFLVYARGKRATHFGNLSTLQRVHGFKRFYLSPAVLIVKIAIVSLLFLAATDSIELRKAKPVTDTNYILMVDSSSSMSKTDLDPSRLEAAKKIALSWLDILPGSTQVGLVSFAQGIKAAIPPSTDKRQIREAIQAIDIDYGQSGTSFDLALNQAFDLFEDDQSKKAILLFTDGTGDTTDLTIARANQRSIRIHVFGIGTNESTPIPDDIPEDFRDLYSDLGLNYSKLSQLATSTSGSAFQATDNEQLSSSFRDVTLEDVQVRLNTNYYIIILITLLSIAELLVYSRLGAL